MEYGSHQEVAAVLAWRRRRNIDLLKVLVGAAAAMGDSESLRKYYDQLIEAAEPEMAEIKRKREAKNLALLESETKKEYVARPDSSIEGRFRPTARRKQRKPKR